MSKDTLVAVPSSTSLGRTHAVERAQGQVVPPAAVSAAADVEAGTEKDEAKRHEHPRWQYVRSLAWLRAVATLLVLYALGLSLLALLYSRLPSLDSLAAKLQAEGGDAAAAAALQLKLPSNFAELRAVKQTLELYRKQYAGQVLTLLVATYWFLQALMIPGSIAINILAGSMYPFWWAMAFTAVMATVGATSNYLVASWLLKDIVTGLFPARVQGFAQELKKHQAHLLNYMLFLRCTPILPAWFINLASPCVGVPLHTFVVATAVGHQPINFITVQAGESVGSMTSFHDLYSPKNVLFLLAVGSLALVPIAVKRRRQGRQGAGQGGGGEGGATVAAAAGLGVAARRQGRARGAPTAADTAVLRGPAAPHVPPLAALRFAAVLYLLLLLAAPPCESPGVPMPDERRPAAVVALTLTL